MKKLIIFICKTAPILILFSFIAFNTGCAWYMAKNGKAATITVYDDGTPRKTVEKDWGNPRSETHVNNMNNTELYIDEYVIKYKHPSNGGRATVFGDVHA